MALMANHYNNITSHSDDVSSYTSWRFLNWLLTLILLLVLWSEQRITYFQIMFYSLRTIIRQKIAFNFIQYVSIYCCQQLYSIALLPRYIFSLKKWARSCPLNFLIHLQSIICRHYLLFRFASTFQKNRVIILVFYLFYYG